MPAPLDRHPFLVPALLASAALALVGPWQGGGGAGRIASGIAAALVLAAFGLTCRASGRVEPAPRPEPARELDWQPLLDRLDRIAAALESRPLGPAVAADELATIASAIAEGRWDDAEAILSRHPDHPDAPHYSGQLGSARQAAGAAMRDELKAAQDVNDPERVLEIHSRLSPVLDAERMAELESQVVKWFLALIMRRLRGGTVRPDVAELAAKVAERFPKSVEGASLRASLATLRRSAGLCPRCAHPYRGIADACPACLAAAAPVQGPDANGSAKAPWAEATSAEEDPSSESPADGPNYPEFLDDPT